MPFLSGISDEMVVADIFNWSPEAGQCISEWHQIVLRGASPLSVAERELIGLEGKSFGTNERLTGA